MLVIDSVVQTEGLHLGFELLHLSQEKLLIGGSLSSGICVAASLRHEQFVELGKTVLDARDLVGGRSSSSNTKAKTGSSWRTCTGRSSSSGDSTIATAFLRGLDSLRLLGLGISAAKSNLEIDSTN